METIKAINEWSYQLMMLAMSITAMTWCGVGIVEAIKFAAKEWFKPANRSVAKPASQAPNGAKQ